MLKKLLLEQIKLNCQWMTWMAYLLPKNHLNGNCLWITWMGIAKETTAMTKSASLCPIGILLSYNCWSILLLEYKKNHYLYHSGDISMIVASQSLSSGSRHNQSSWSKNGDTMRIKCRVIMNLWTTLEITLCFLKTFEKLSFINFTGLC